MLGLLYDKSLGADEGILLGNDEVMELSSKKGIVLGSLDGKSLGTDEGIPLGKDEGM